MLINVTQLKSIFTDDLRNMPLSLWKYSDKFWIRTQLSASRRKFLTVWPSNASRHKAVYARNYNFLRLAWTCEPICESVWPPIACPYASSSFYEIALTCLHWRVRLASDISLILRSSLFCIGFKFPPPAQVLPRATVSKDNTFPAHAWMASF